MVYTNNFLGRMIVKKTGSKYITCGMSKSSDGLEKKDAQ